MTTKNRLSCCGFSIISYFCSFFFATWIIIYSNNKHLINNDKVRLYLWWQDR